MSDKVFTMEDNLKGLTFVANQEDIGRITVLSDYGHTLSLSSLIGFYGYSKEDFIQEITEGILKPESNRKVYTEEDVVVGLKYYNLDDTQVIWEVADVGICTIKTTWDGEVSILSKSGFIQDLGRSRTVVEEGHKEPTLKTSIKSDGGKTKQSITYNSCDKTLTVKGRTHYFYNGSEVVDNETKVIISILKGGFIPPTEKYLVELYLELKRLKGK